MDTQDTPLPPRVLYQKIETPEDREDDFFEVQVAGKTARVFRPLKHGKRQKSYYVKFYIGGRQVLQSLGVDTKGFAAEGAKLKLRAAMEGRWDALDQSRLRPARSVCTIGELIEAYETKIQSFSVKMKDRTAAGYTSALRSVLRRVYPGDADEVRASALTSELVEKFFAAYVTEATDLVDRDSKIRGANAALRNARAMFCDAALKCYRGLSLPGEPSVNGQKLSPEKQFSRFLEGFLTTETLADPRIEHMRMAPESIWQMSQAALCLRDQFPALYVAHLLFRHLALRNDEAENARLGWLEKRSDTVTLPNGERRAIAGAMVIKPRPEWIPKKSSGEVPIAPAVWREIRRYSGAANPEDFLIPARTKTEREWIVDRDHGNFVRQWVQGHAKTSYELRRWAATIVARRQGDEYAERFLRHAPKTVAGRHYLTDHAPIAPITFRDCGL